MKDRNNLLGLWNLENQNYNVNHTFNAFRQF